MQVSAFAVALSNARKEKKSYQVVVGSCQNIFTQTHQLITVNPSLDQILITTFQNIPAFFVKCLNIFLYSFDATIRTFNTKIDMYKK